MKYTFGLIGLISLALTSCATSEYYMADDAYVVKPSDLPVGESTADETSYAAFKKRKRGDTGEQLTYQDDWHSRNNRRCLSEPIWYQGCGCSFSYWSAYSPYSSRNMSMGFGYASMYNYSYYNSMFFNPYMVWGPYGYNAFVIGMNYYATPYYPYYGYNPMPSYGWGYPYYNGGGYGYGGNGYAHAQNVHFGPRGSVAGYSNPSGRATNGSIKSTTAGTTPIRPRASQSATISRRPVENTNAYRTPSSVSNTSSVQRPSGTSRPTTTGRSVSRSYGTTYSRTDGTTRQPARTNTNYNSGNRSSGNSTINSGSSSRSGSGINYSSGSSSRSGGNSSSGSSRSGSSGTSHSGRR